MYQVFSSFLLALLVAALTVACTQSVSSPTPASAAYTSAQLEGSWTLASIAPAGEAKQDRPFNAVYTLTFTDGKMSTRADCNTCGGSFSVSAASVLTAGPNLACTRAACPTMAFENTYTAILSGDSNIVVTGSTLTLSSSRGTLQFVRN